MRLNHLFSQSPLAGYWEKSIKTEVCVTDHAVPLRTLLKLTILKIFSGVYSGEATHVPFPNTVVKSSSGDGTAYLSVGE